jgi:hypothetical protein
VITIVLFLLQITFASALFTFHEVTKISRNIDREIYNFELRILKNEEFGNQIVDYLFSKIASSFLTEKTV